MRLICDGVDDDIQITAEEEFYVETRRFICSMSNNWQINEADNHILNYNSDATSANCEWIDKGDVEMRLDSGGDLAIDGSLKEDGADYAEYFESLDGKSIKSGITVVLEEDKIRPAKKGEVPIGVISGHPAIIGNNDEHCGTEWKHKYMKNEMGEYIYEDAQFWSIRQVKKKRFRDGRDPSKEPKQKSGWVDRTEKVPKNAKIKTVKRKKLNPEWDPNIKYTPRKKRLEWNIVGLLGQIRIRKGQPVAPNWIKMKEISDKVDLYLIK
jgi:hypothetical protein